MLILLAVGFVLSVGLTAMSLSLRALSTPYLKYWAKRGDLISKRLYPLKSGGSSVQLTIELLRSLAISGSLILLANQLWGVWAWLIGAAVLFLVFVVLGELYLKPMGTRLLAWSSGGLITASQLLKPIVVPLGRVFDRFMEDEPVVLTRSELSRMVNTVETADTDLSADELRIVRHSLTFGEKKVNDIMTPRSVVVSVKETDVLSPLLLDELHKSGHSRFPVFNIDNNEAVGLLFVKDLFDVRDHTRIKEVMRSPAHFVNQERELDHVLQAFIRTKQHMFLVVNEFAEITGLITIEDVVEQVLGKPIIDEFDKYDSMRDVAEARAKVVRKQVKMVE